MKLHQNLVSTLPLSTHDYKHVQVQVQVMQFIFQVTSIQEGEDKSDKVHPRLDKFTNHNNFT